MTTISTIHDLHRILVEHPEWRSELRRILLTEELLELPQRFAKYAKVTDGKLDALTTEVRQNTNHIGELKGMFMERTAREDGAIIASNMGLQWRKALDRGEVVQIVEGARRSGSGHIERSYAGIRPRRLDFRSNGSQRG